MVPQTKFHKIIQQKVKNANNTTINTFTTKKYNYKNKITCITKLSTKTWCMYKGLYDNTKKNQIQQYEKLHVCA